MSDKSDLARLFSCAVNCYPAGRSSDGNPVFDTANLPPDVRDASVADWVAKFSTWNTGRKYAASGAVDVDPATAGKYWLLQIEVTV